MRAQQRRQANLVSFVEPWAGIWAVPRAQINAIASIKRPHRDLRDRFDSAVRFPSSETAQSAILKAGSGCEGLALPFSAPTGRFAKRGAAGDFLGAGHLRGGNRHCSPEVFFTSPVKPNRLWAGEPAHFHELRERLFLFRGPGDHDSLR